MLLQVGFKHCQRVHPCRLEQNRHIATQDSWAYYNMLLVLIKQKSNGNAHRRSSEYGHVLAGQQFTNTDCHTAGQFIQTTCADFTAVIKQRFNEINNADCGSLSASIGGGQYGRPGPQ